MRLTEEEIKKILDYGSDISKELLNHLKRHYPTYEQKDNWVGRDSVKWIFVDGKLRLLLNNKKYLTNKISSELEDMWIGIGIPTIRRTVKKYLDGVM